MLFTSSIFLFIFFPVCLAGYYFLRKEARNIFLLIASLVFYAWGEPRLVLLLIAGIGMNYGFGLVVTF